MRNPGICPLPPDKVGTRISRFTEIPEINVVETLSMLSDFRMNNSIASFWAVVIGITGCHDGIIKKDCGDCLCWKTYL